MRQGYITIRTIALSVEICWIWLLLDGWESHNGNGRCRLLASTAVWPIKLNIKVEGITPLTEDFWQKITRQELTRLGVHQCFSHNASTMHFDTSVSATSRTIKYRIWSIFHRLSCWVYSNDSIHRHYLWYLRITQRSLTANLTQKRSYVFERSFIVTQSALSFQYFVEKSLSFW